MKRVSDEFLEASWRQIDEHDFCLPLGWYYSKFQLPHGITGPSKGVPLLLSYGDFLSASVSYLFRK